MRGRRTAPRAGCARGATWGPSSAAPATTHNLDVEGRSSGCGDSGFGAAMFADDGAASPSLDPPIMAANAARVGAGGRSMLRGLEKRPRAEQEIFA